MKFMSLVVVIFAVSSAAPIQGDIVTSNIANADVGHSTAHLGQWLATSFSTDDMAYSLDTIDFKVDNAINTTSPLILSLLADNTGSPGIVLDDLAGPTSPDSGDFTYTPTIAINLDPLTTYWVVGRVLTGAGVYNLRLTNDPSQIGPGTIGNHFWASFDQGTTWSQDAALPLMFTINGSVVPEPAMPLASFLIMFVAIGLTCRRNRATNRAENRCG